jgi:hypothetical protein
MAAYVEDPIYLTLKEALTCNYKVDALRKLAKIVCNGMPSRKADIVDAICRVMLGRHLKSWFDKLGSIEKAAVQEGVFAPDGRLDATQFKAKYQQALPPGRSRGWGADGDLVELFIVSRRVPADLREKLAAFVKKPKADCISYIEKLPEFVNFDSEEETEKRSLYVRNTAAAALNNLQTVLRLVEGGKLKVGGKTLRPTLATQKNLAELLQDGDWYGKEDILGGIGHIQAFAWPVLLQGAGLAKADGSTLKLTAKGKKALAGKRSHVIRDAWARWEKTKFFDEFSRVDRIKGQKASRSRALFSVQTRRPDLYEGLLLCTPGKWLTVKELIRAMSAKGLDFDVARYPWKLYMGNPHYGNLGEYDDQEMINIRYALAFLFEYAATLGLINVAYVHPDGAFADVHSLWGWDMDGGDFLSRYDGLIYIRINALGAFAMELTDIYEPRSAENRAVFTVLPNHDVVVTDAPSLSPGDRLFLEKICRKKSSSLWRLTTRTLLAAAQNGTSIKEIKTFLKSRSAQPVPETVTVLLDDAKKRSTGLEYAGRTHLVACQNAMVQRLVSSDQTLSKMCLPAGKKHLAIMPGKEKKFMKALARLGYIVPQLREQV